MESHEYGGVLFVNCGSVGKPKDGDPRGAFAVLEVVGAEVVASIERFDYDAELTSRRSRRRRAAGRVRRQAAGCGMREAGDAPLPRRLLPSSSAPPSSPRTVIGSGIAAAQLSPNDVGLQLLENAAATAAGLFTFILMFGPVSGAHFNPVVSLVDAAFGGLRWRHALAYIPAQVAGCITGAVGGER